MGLVVKTAPVLFLFSLLALGAHLAILLGVGKLLGFSRRELLIASNANIGGKGWAPRVRCYRCWPVTAERTTCRCGVSQVCTVVRQHGGMAGHVPSKRRVHQARLLRSLRGCSHTLWLLVKPSADYSTASGTAAAAKGQLW